MVDAEVHDSRAIEDELLRATSERKSGFFKVHRIHLGSTEETR